MKPETAFYAAKGREVLRQAEVMAPVGESDAAGRAAYLAAQALIFERETRVVKTHKGVIGE